MCVLQAACQDVLMTTCLKEGFNSCLATGSSCGRRRCRASSMWRRMSLCDSCNSMFGTAIARRILCFSSRKGASVRDDPQDVHVSREAVRKGRDGRSLGDHHHDLEHDGDLHQTKKASAVDRGPWSWAPRQFRTRCVGAAIRVRAFPDASVGASTDPSGSATDRSGLMRSTRFA